MQTRQPLQRLVLTLLAIGLGACQMATPVTGARPPALRGQVRWTFDGLHTAATVGDIQTNGTVWLVDPATGQTVEATQSSTSNGTFAMPFTDHGVTLAPGYYWLEAARFIAGSRRAGVTLKTILQYTGSGWDSISGTDVQISPLTTAIARVRALDPAVTDAATIGAVVAPHQVVADLVTYTPAVLNQLATEISDTVTAGGDGAGDLPLPATITPTTGTPGITQLHWTGIPLSFDFHTQWASGQDGLGVAQTETSPAALQASGWTSTAPASLVGPSQVRLQTGSARTLPQTWTPLMPSTLNATASVQLAATDGTAGPLVAWKGQDAILRVADVTANGLGPVTTLGSGGDELAVGSSASGQNHLIFVTAGLPFHRSSTGPNWSAAQAVPGIDPPIANPVIVPDGTGGIWAAWLSGPSGAQVVQVARWVNSTWQAPEIAVSGASAFAMTGGPEPQIAFVDPLNWVSHTQRRNGDWTNPERLSAGGVYTSDPAIVTDAAGQPLVVWSNLILITGSEKSQVLAYRSKQAGAWTAEENLAPSVVPQTAKAHLALDANGVPVISWLNGTDPAIVQISRRTATPANPGSWGKPITLGRASAFALTGASLSDRHWLFWLDGTTSVLTGVPVVW